LSGFGVSIAAEVDGDAVIGVVADPVRGDIYTATKGGGANLNGSRIRASALTDLSTALVGTGFSYDPSRRRRQATVLMQVIPEVRDIRRFGAASLDLCLVASGRLDAYYEKGLSRWDYAAGALVAAEAGARLGDLDGGAGSSEFMLASATGLFEPLRDLLDRAGARDA
jgi:myo-inositol-1(or 4)-monophosphatase